MCGTAGVPCNIFCTALYLICLLLVCRATLVICAVSLVGQWLDEAKSKLDGSLRLYMYHGSGRNRDAGYLATNFDLVVTTYQVSPANFAP